MKFTPTSNLGQIWPFHVNVFRESLLEVALAVLKSNPDLTLAGSEAFSDLRVISANVYGDKAGLLHLCSARLGQQEHFAGKEALEKAAASGEPPEHLVTLAVEGSPPLASCEPISLDGRVVSSSRRYVKANLKRDHYLPEAEYRILSLGKDEFTARIVESKCN